MSNVTIYHNLACGTVSLSLNDILEGDYDYYLQTLPDDAYADSASIEY